MTSPTVSSRNFLLVSASVLAWLLVLSVLMKLFFGARMSGGWVIAGTMFTLVVGGAIMMVKEIQSALFDTLHMPRHLSHTKPAAPPTRHQDSDSAKSTGTPPPPFNRTPHPRREALGLGADYHFSNRRRRSFVRRPGPTMQEKFRYWLIANNLTCLIRD